jgi:glucokinase
MFDLISKAYGSEAGVAALKWLPYGGLYLTGGLTPKNIALIQDPEGPFMAALLDKVK